MNTKNTNAKLNGEENTIENLQRANEDGEVERKGRRLTSVSELGGGISRGYHEKKKRLQFTDEYKDNVKEALEAARNVKDVSDQSDEIHQDSFPKHAGHINSSEQNKSEQPLLPASGSRSNFNSISKLLIYIDVSISPYIQIQTGIERESGDGYYEKFC